MKPSSQKTLSTGTRRLAGLLIIELDDLRWSRGLEKWLADWQPAGVLMGGSSLSTPSATAKLLAKIAQTINTAPILALREFGGSRGTPWRAPTPDRILPSPRAVARQGPRAARKLGELFGAAMRQIGFNTLFGPSLDLLAPYSDLLLDDRLFSSDPEVVASCGGAFIQSLRRHGILAAPGHFPGISDATLDRISKTHVADKTMAEMWREDLVPYRRLLRRAPFVVTSHLPYKAYDLDLARPACISNNVLQGLLRDKLGFRGVAIADVPDSLQFLLKSVVASQHRAGFVVLARPNAYVEPLLAGCDLQVVGPNERMARFVVAGLEHSADPGALPRQRLEVAVRRVRAAKRGLRRPTGRLNRKAFEKLARECDDFAKTCRE